MEGAGAGETENGAEGREPEQSSVADRERELVVDALADAVLAAEKGEEGLSPLAVLRR